MTNEDEITGWLTSLRADGAGGEPRPDRPVLLLAVLELAETGRLPTNAVPFTPTLFELFGAYWDAAADGPPGRVQAPFWHLDAEPFWDLVMRADSEGERSNKTYTPSARQISEWVLFARLDDRLFAAAQEKAARNRLRGAIVAHYFPERAERVAAVREFERGVQRYTERIGRPGKPDATARATPVPVRDAAFRRVVTEAYGYTCAVSGARITLAAGGAHGLVQAVHIQTATRDDSPQNGIALSPDYRWMFERGLFTLDERWRVRVSPAARDCVGTVDTLLGAHHRRPIRLPVDQNLWPGQDFLDGHRAQTYLAG